MTRDVYSSGAPGYAPANQQTPTSTPAIENELIGLHNALDLLGAYVGELAVRTDCVRRPEMGKDQANQVTPPRPVASLVTNQLSAAGDKVGALQKHLRSIIDTLEI